MTLHSSRHRSLKSITATYQLLGTAGHGQYGQVHCARHLQTQELVALKQLPPERFPTHQLLRELRHLLALDHDHINRCYALEHAQEGRFLVLEYCAGGTLRDLINQAYPLTFGEVIDFGLQLLAGLSHAHAQRVIHCDIKPENILLQPTRDGWQLKLTDFGIARQQQVSRGEITATGSPAYMAPERFYGSATVASDLYAVGIILFELLTGKRPFSGNPAQLMYAHLNKGISFATHQDRIPAPLQSVIEKSLRKLPGRRYPNADSMAQALRTLVGIPLTQWIHLDPPVCPLRDLTLDLQSCGSALVDAAPDPSWIQLSQGIQVQIKRQAQSQESVAGMSSTQATTQLVVHELKDLDQPKEAESWDLAFDPDLTVASQQTLLCRDTHDQGRLAWIRVRPFQVRRLLYSRPIRQMVGFDQGFGILDDAGCLILLNNQAESVTCWQLPAGSEWGGWGVNQTLTLRVAGSLSSLDLAGILRDLTEVGSG